MTEETYEAKLVCSATPQGEINNINLNEEREMKNGDEIYEIYRDHGTHRELIGNLRLDTILEIHGKNIKGICEIKKEVTVIS